MSVNTLPNQEPILISNKFWYGIWIGMSMEMLLLYELVWKQKALGRAIQCIYYEHILLSANYSPVPIFSKYLP